MDINFIYVKGTPISQKGDSTLEEVLAVFEHRCQKSEARSPDAKDS